MLSVLKLPNVRRSISRVVAGLLCALVLIACSEVTNRTKSGWHFTTSHNSGVSYHASATNPNGDPCLRIEVEQFDADGNSLGVTSGTDSVDFDLNPNATKAVATAEDGSGAIETQEWTDFP